MVQRAPRTPRCVTLAVTFGLCSLATASHAANQVVTNNSDSGAGSLRQAITDVHDGGTITFDDDYTITLVSDLPRIGKDVTITGRGCKQTIIDGAGSYQPFYVQMNGSLTLSHLTVRNGACISNYGVLNLDGVDLHGNTGYAGALQQASTGTGATIVNSAIYGNTATNRGGAIHATVGTVTIKNTTIFNNVSEYYGGGICVEGADFVVDSCTIANNSFSGSYNSSKGGGIVMMGGTLTIQNTVLANNQQNNGANDYSYFVGGTLTDNGYNFVEVSNTSDATGFSNGVNNNIVGTDPTGLANSLTYEGGWTPVLKITAGTFTGGNYGATAETRDQRGYHRKTGEITRGAYQYGGIVARHFFGAWDGGYETIAAALAAASSGDVVNVLDTVIKETGITISQDQAVVGLTSDCQIWGDDEAATAASRIIQITGGSVLIQGVTIRYGNVAGAGGAIFNNGATLELGKCVIADNTATLDGGGVYSETGGTLRMSACTIRDNTTAGDKYGGGVCARGTVSIAQSTLSGNSAGLGAGLCLFDANARVQDCTICGNTSSSHGGGVLNHNSITALANCTISGNESSGGLGGGFCNESGQAGLLNTIVINNTASDDGDINVNAGVTYAQSAWYYDASGVTVPATAANVTAAYTAGDLLALADNGGDTPTMELAATAPAVGTGDFVYYNAADGYYCEDSNGDYLDALGSTITPADPANDKITTDQRGTARTAPVSIGAYFTTSPNPHLTTTSASSVTASSASSGGNVTYEGTSGVTARGVCWSTDENPTVDDDKTSDGTGSGSFTSSITGLSAARTYYVRAYATNASGTSYGNQVEFTTNSTAPTVTTAEVSDITTTTAAGGGEITSTGGAAPTACGVCWNTTGAPTTADDKTQDLMLKGLTVASDVRKPNTYPYTSSMTDLNPGTTYYVRAYAINAAGTGYGSEVQFTTEPSTPIVTTAMVSDITANSAACGGEVTSDSGASVTVRGVCWNTAGTPTTDDSKTSDGTGTGAFTSDLTGLDPNTTYYVRAYATNSEGTSYGDEQTFTTTTTSGPNDDGSTAPDLRVSIAAATTAARVGEELGFEVNVANLGTASATGVILRFPLPPGTELVGVWLLPDESAQTAPLDAVVDGDEIVVELGDVLTSEALTLSLVLKAATAGTVTLTAAATCAEQDTPATTQAESEVAVDDVYVEIVRVVGPLNACGLLGFMSFALTALGLLTMKHHRRYR